VKPRLETAQESIMLKKVAVALGLLVAVGAASTAANATDYRYRHGYHGRDHVHTYHRPYWRYRPHVAHRYSYYHSRHWRAEHRARRYARWWHHGH
jgi:hypothetical protein